jgi:hypothetical protein
MKFIEKAQLSSTSFSNGKKQNKLEELIDGEDIFNGKSRTVGIRPFNLSPNRILQLGKKISQSDKTNGGNVRSPCFALNIHKTKTSVLDPNRLNQEG